MAVVTADLLRSLDRGLTREFMAARTAAKPKSRWRRVASRIPSANAAEVQAWIRGWPAMAEWSAGTSRVYADIAEAASLLPNTTWANGIKIPRTAIEDDRVGIYGRNVQMLGTEADASVDREVFRSLSRGHIDDGPDSKKFFASDHEVATNVDGTGGPVDTANVILGAPQDAVHAAGTGTGEVVSDGAVTGPDEVAIEITTGGVVGTSRYKWSLNGGAQSAARATATAPYTIPGTQVTVAFIDDASSSASSFKTDDEWTISGREPWYLLDGGWPIRPLIYQDRLAVEIQSTMRNPTADSVMDSDEWKFGARARRAFGYGLWQMAAMSTEDLDEDSFDRAYQLVQEQTWDGGIECGFTPDCLVCPPALRGKALATVATQYGVGGKSNRNYQAVDVIDTQWVKPVQI